MLQRPTLRHRAGNPYSIVLQRWKSERTVGLFGLSTRKAYPMPTFAQTCVGSYPSFSPLPHSTHKRGDVGRSFSVMLAVTVFFQKLPPSVRRYAALCCPDFPPRRTTNRQKRGDGTTCGRYFVYILVYFYPCTVPVAPKLRLGGFGIYRVICNSTCLRLRAATRGWTWA